MTIVVAIKDGAVVLMGSDSAASDDDGEILVQRHPKIFRWNLKSCEILVGFAGDFATAQLLEYCFKPPPYDKGDDVKYYLVSDLVPALRKFAAKKILKDDVSPLDMFTTDTSFLLAAQGRIFVLSYNGQVEEPLLPFASIGTGARAANGALHALHESGQVHGSLNSWDALQLSLQAAEAQQANVRRPWHMDAVFQ